MHSAETSSNDENDASPVSKAYGLSNSNPGF